MFNKFVFTTLLLLGLLGSLAAQTTVQGTVTDPAGTPLTGANLILLPGDRGAASDADGRFSIKNVPGGDYTLRVSYVGYETLRKPVKIADGQAGVTLQLTLEPRAFTAEELTVRATRAGATTPMTYLNVDKADIDPVNLAQDLPFLLRWTPSVVSTSDAGAGVGYTGIRIRGTDPTRINVTVNGIPINDAESQGVFWVNMPDFASSASDIQIQRGVGTSTNGAGAFGATININTTELKPEAYATLNGSVGSFNTQRTNVEFGSGLLNGKFTLDGRLSRITSDGFIDRASSDLSSYYLSAAYLGESSSLRFVTFSGQERTYQAWYGVPKDFLEVDSLRTFNPSGTEKEGEPYENEVDNYGQDHYQLIYNNQINTNWSFNTALHYTRGAGYFEQYKAGEALADYGLMPVDLVDTVITQTNLVRRLWLDNDFYGGVYSLNYISDDNRLDATLGGGYHRYLGDHFGEVTWAEYASNSEKDYRYYENDATKSDLNVYAKFNYELLDGLHAYLDLQYRRVGYEFLGIDRQGNNVEQTEELGFFNPKAGLFYRISSRSEAFASFAVANREPNRNDFVESTADSQPNPESLYDTEIGYEYRWDRAAIHLTGYYMLYRDQLVLNGEVNDVGAYTRVNVDRSYRLGLEVAGGAQLADGLRLDGNFTLSRNRIANYTEFVDMYDENFAYLGQEAFTYEETDLSFSPDIIAAGGLSYEALRLKDKTDLIFTLQTKYVGQQYIDNTSDEDNALDAYSFSDFRINFNWRPGFLRELSLKLLVQNVFDAQYETNAWSYRYQFDGSTTLDQGFFPQAGRNFLIGLSVGL
jgi:iron complex outermembrane receptor protein